MNKQDTAANREWIKSVTASAGSVPAARAMVGVAVSARFPGKMDRQDDLVALFETMQAEEFDRLMGEEAIADGRAFRASDGRVLRRYRA